MNKKLVALFLLVGVSGIVFTGCNVSEPAVEDTENSGNVDVINVIDEELVEPMEEEVSEEEVVAEDTIDEEEVSEEVVVEEDTAKIDETMEEEVTE